MKKVKIIYWVSTGLISLLMSFSAYMYLASDMIKGAFAHIGFPSYFRIELAVAKLLGIIALLLPSVKGVFKEWAYFGFFVTFISALVAHISSGDTPAQWSMVVVATVLLMASYFSWHKLSDVKVLSK